MKKLLRGAVIGYLVVVIVLGFFQRYLMYHPRQAETLPVAAFRDVRQLFPKARDVRLTCSDGVEIGGWLLQKNPDLPGKQQSRPLVLYFHGNAGNRANRVNWYRIFERSGADVLAIDYHGYGDSGGTMSESALEQDALAAWKLATEQLGYQATQIVIAGTSLGGAAAVYLAAEMSHRGDAPSGLIVVASFSSMVDVASSIYWWLPVGAILADRYPSADRIGRVTSRILVLHGDDDELVRIRFGKRLFDAAPANSHSGEPKRWITLSGVGHNDILSSGGHIVEQEIAKFLK